MKKLLGTLLAATAMLTGVAKAEDQLLTGKLLYYRMYCPNVLKVHHLEAHAIQEELGGADLAVRNLEAAEKEIAKMGRDRFCNDTRAILNQLIAGKARDEERANQP